MSRWFYSIQILLLVTLVACTSSKEGGLITDAIPLSNCPQNSCANGVADPAETKIVLQTALNNVMAEGSSFAEVSGDCYASLYPQNFFEVSITFNGANIQNYFPAGFVPRCDRGKFYFPISLEGGLAGSYVLSARMVVVDAQGIQIRPPFTQFQTTLIKR